MGDCTSKSHQVHHEKRVQQSYKAQQQSYERDFMAKRQSTSQMRRQSTERRSSIVKGETVEQGQYKREKSESSSSGQVSSNSNSSSIKTYNGHLEQNSTMSETINPTGAWCCGRS